ncbi:hypothetical protein [Thermococcus sp. PK]|uniref:hypothetical protein n=1 Tax=Thermococcus sp. PK TaxID=913025 RepID=UPI0005B2B706|nr:hypothetical protein [Thermococcus sp. PK]
MKAEQVILYLRNGTPTIEVLRPTKAWKNIIELEMPVSAFVSLVAETLDTEPKRGEAIMKYTRAKDTLRLYLNRLRIEVSPKKPLRLKLQNGKYPQRFIPVLVVGIGDLYDYLPELLKKRRQYVVFKLQEETESRRIYTLELR